MSELVKAAHVHKVYPGGSKVAALRGVDLTIARGEFTALAGPSGSGKSTLLNLIGTLDRPTKGEIRYEGRIVSTLDADALSDFRLRTLGFVFQAFNLIPVLTAAENVEYPLVLQGVEDGERRRRAHEALRQVGLESLSERRPDLLDLMENLNRDHDVTFLFSSHDGAVLERARRVVRLQDGELKSDDARKTN